MKTLHLYLNTKANKTSDLYFYLITTYLKLIQYYFRIGFKIGERNTTGPSEASNPRSTLKRLKKVKLKLKAFFFLNFKI